MWEGEKVGTWERDESQLAGEIRKESSIERFEDLQVWQTARELTKGIYRAVRAQALRQDDALANQMKRSVVSIGANITEGCERGTRKRQIESCFIAKGSAGGLRSQVITADDVGLIDDRAYEWLLETCEKCSRQLAAYVTHLRRTEKSIRGLKHAMMRSERESG